MKFLAMTLITHTPQPLTGVRTPTVERFAEVVANAQLAELLGQLRVALAVAAALLEVWKGRSSKFD